jgi:hypothetical protein
MQRSHRTGWWNGCSRLAVSLGLVSLTLTACSGDEEGSASSRPPPTDPPPVVETTQPCVLNADCPAGQYCDLGECLQECNVEAPCSEGGNCSLRGRCLPPEEPEVQPEPEPAFQGTVSVEPEATVIAPADRVLELRLSSNSPDPVRYRVELSAPHLSLAEHRGEFTGSTTLKLDVDSTRARPLETEGTITIVTTLGDLVVTAPIQPSISGYYQGTMRYEVGNLMLGDASVGLEIFEEAGQVRVRFDPRASLLFPEAPAAEGGAGQPASGAGVFSKADGKIDATIYQSLPAAFAGARNYLARDVTRTLRLNLVPGSLGTMEGSFTEDIRGIFPQAARASGRISLQYVADREVSEFEPTRQAPPVPTVSAGSYLAPIDVFGWTGDGGVCATVAPSGCVAHPDPAGCRADLAAAAPVLSEKLLEPLYSDMLLSDRSALPFDTMADRCQAALGVKTIEGYQADPSAKFCGLVVPFGCLLDVLANRVPDPTLRGQVYSDSVARLAAPVLLVAKNEVTRGLEASFRQGYREEGNRYDAALTTIRPMGRWLLQPSVVEQLRAMPDEAAQGTGASSTTSTVLESYPAARALAELFHTLSTVDGERSRITATTSTTSSTATLKATQERAVIAYLEAATLGRIVQGWSGIPPSVTSRFSGLLNPMNRGFSTLVQGGSVLGVAEGFVPFVYRPEDAGSAGPTNFEQMLAIAQNQVAAESQAESTWLAAGRTFEQNNSLLQNELASVRGRYDQRLREICGPAFDPNSPASGWEVCGHGEAGEIALRRVEVERAGESLKNHYRRAENKLAMIQISMENAARVLGKRAEEMQLIDNVGKTVNGLTLGTRIISEVQTGLLIASNAQLWNAGAPLALAVTAGVLGAVKVVLETAKDDLLLFEKLEVARISAEVEYLNAMSNAKRELIEQAQIAVEAQETALVLVQAKIAERNLMDQARSLMEERSRVMAVLGKNPANDPSYRLIRDKRALEVLAYRSSAQTQLLLAGRALEFELNMSLSGLDGAVLNANNAYALEQLTRCFKSIHDQRRLAFGSPQEYVTTVSLRKLLGILAPRVDSVTGEELSEGRQFREYLLRNQNLDGQGGVGLAFSTTLDPDNGLWSTDVCSDRVKSIEAQIVGDFLGDDEAQVNLQLQGTSLLRECDTDAIQSWSLGGGDSSSAVAIIQAGVNDFGKATPNTSLFGQSVARATWRIVIPGASSAPGNQDVDLTKIEDVVLRITHSALARRTSGWNPDVSCLAF